MLGRRLAILVVASSLIVPLASAHVTWTHYEEDFVGHGCDVVDGRLQAECFTTGDPGCSPDYDSEHTIAWGPQPQWDGGYAAFAPHAGCGLHFDDLVFPEDTHLLGINLRTNGQAAASLSYVVTILVDGASVVSQGLSLPPDVDTLLALPSTVVIPAGTHSLSIEYAVTGGTPGYANLIVDFVDFGHGCVNLAPVLGLLDVDGLLNGLTGWVGYGYDFALPEVYDPDGDPLTVTWAFGDGVTLEGVEVSRSFLDKTVTSLTVTVTDNPVLRCAEAIAKTVTRTLSFQAISLLDLDILGLASGTICNAGEQVASTLDYPLLASTCSVGATVRPASPAVVDRIEWRVDGSTLWTSTASAPSITYDARKVADGFRTLEACALAKNDKHGLQFCDSRTVYDLDCTNAAPQLAGFAGDGMGGGLVGWKGLSYALSASGLRDPDGDPLTVRWVWSDGRVSQGPTVLRSFGTTGLQSATVTVTDDPSLRCPGFPARSVTQTLTFNVVPDWTVTLVRPGAGKSCVGDVVAPAFGQDPIMAGFCTVRASVTTGDARLAPGALGRIRVDQMTFSEGATDLVEAFYDSTRFSSSLHDMDACFRATGDKYGREFCSAPQTYMNIGG